METQISLPVFEHKAHFKDFIKYKCNYCLLLVAECPTRGESEAGDE